MRTIITGVGSLIAMTLMTIFYMTSMVMAVIVSMFTTILGGNQ